MNNHAMPKIEEAVASDRRVGLGITGMADAFVLMKKRYDSEEALESIDKIMATICHNSYETSVELAKEKGALGGKIIGAGGGGFLMFYCSANRKAALRQALAEAGLREMSYDFDFEGAKIIVNL